MTIFLSERDVEGLLNMKEVVSTVEEAFRREGIGEASNSMRTRSRGESSILNVMHANLSYLGRSGLKAYVSSKSGTRFVVMLFDASTSTPLAVMGADMLGRFRTGAASGVATKYLYGKRSGTLALFGSGKQAFTQALAVDAVMTLEEVRVWSPNVVHRGSFVRTLQRRGLKAKESDSPSEALNGAQVVSTITSSREPFLTGEMLEGISHANVCGGNIPGHAEITTDAVGRFRTVVVDDLPQAKIEYGDLIRAAQAGEFSWGSAVELSSIISGGLNAKGPTLFKSGGAALEDVAVASILYDRAKSEGGYPDFQLT